MNEFLSLPKLNIFFMKRRSYLVNWIIVNVSCDFVWYVNKCFVWLVFQLNYQCFDIVFWCFTLMESIVFYKSHTKVFDKYHLIWNIKHKIWNQTNWQRFSVFLIFLRFLTQIINVFNCEKTKRLRIVKQLLLMIQNNLEKWSPDVWNLLNLFIHG